MSELYITPTELQQQLTTSQPPTVIDVRSAEEYAAGHLPGARHIPDDALAQQQDEIPRDRPVVPY